MKPFRLSRWRFTSMFVGALMAEGITKDQIRLMGRETPGTLSMG
jgi:hypothetical protein